MEKAKLLVQEGKKKKINAQLRFEDGKIMPLPYHQLKDISLNNMEVDVERQAGQIVLVQIGDKILYNAHAQEKKPAQSQPSRRPDHATKSQFVRETFPKPPSTQTQSSSRKDWQYQHISHVRNPAYAPYNFIPLNRRVVEINPTIPLANKYDAERNTGWIDLEIEALTPLYIRGTLTKDEMKAGWESKDKPEFFAPANRIRIPGSSLRGMVRNMSEIASFGRFHFFEDRRLYYRGLADRSNLRTEYQQRMSSYDRSKRRPQYNFSVGILRKQQTNKRGLHFEIKSSGSNFKQIFKDEARKLVQAGGQEYAPFNFYAVDEGYIVVSGDMPNKKRDWLISHPPVNAEIISIPDEDMRSYIEDRTRDDRVPNLLELARQSKNDEGDVPCFYVRWQDANGKDRVSFGHTGMFRLAYEKAIGEHVSTISHRIDDQTLQKAMNVVPKSSFEKVRKLNGKEYTLNELAATLESKELKWGEIKKVLQSSAKIDFTEAVFGNEHTFAGRVFFEDAFLIGSQNGSQMGEETPQILSTPKPTTFQHYLVQNSDEVRQLNHYNSLTALRGYKLYWHKSGERWVETDQAKLDSSPSQYTKIKPVKAGTRFFGRIRFENLSDKELGALLFSLDLPEGCAHKLGMGKPLGLGSVRLNPRLYLSDRQKRYRNFSAEWDNKIAPADAEFEKIKREFEKYVMEKLGEDSSKRLWETERLRELLVMLQIDAGKELEKIGANNYMRIEPQNEFKNRYVLPSASRIASSSKIEETLKQLRVPPKTRARMADRAGHESTTDKHLAPVVEREKITHIKKIEIKGLWDKFNIDWPVDKSVSILVGVNGSGKSTILELINYALAGEYANPQKVKYSPKELSIVFDNDEKISYRRTENGVAQVSEPSSQLLPEFVSTFDAPLELEGTGKDESEKTQAQLEKQLASKLWERIDRFFNEIDALRELKIDPTPYIDELIHLVNEEVFIRTLKKLEFVGEIKFTQEWLNQFLAANEVSDELRIRLEGLVSDEGYKLDEKFPNFLESKIGKANASQLRSKILQYVEFLHESARSYAVFCLDDSRILMPDQLSTGEKQMLIILFTALILKLRTLVSEDRRYVLIMDEPENSLHLKWQKFLISYIRRLNESVQIIIATHAPAIIKKGYLVNTVEMSEIKSEAGV